MGDKVALRCSKLPLGMKCASAWLPVKNPIFEPEPEFNDPAELGTAVHMPLARMVVLHDPELGLDEVAEKFNVDADDLSQLYYYGKRCWPMMREHFGENPVAEEYFEREFPTFILSGHPDILGDKTMERRAGADWKSGRVEYNAAWQLFGLRPLCGVELGLIVWLRETWSGEPFEVIAIPPEQEIIDKLTAQVAAMHKGGCVTGPHCLSMYCERRHECEAYQAMVRDSVTALVDFEDGETLPAPEVVARGYAAWKEYEALSKRFKSLMNEVLDAQGEIILPGGDKKLVRLTTHPKVFDAQAALAVMTDYGIENPAACFRVAVGPLEKAVKATPPMEDVEVKQEDGSIKVERHHIKGPWKKGAHYAEFLRDCETAGAMTYGERKTRREVRV